MFQSFRMAGAYAQEFSIGAQKGYTGGGPQMPAGFARAGQKFGTATGYLGRGTGRAASSYFASDMHRGGMRWVKESYGLGSMKGLGRVFGLGWLGYNAISGYQQGGISGAVGNIAEDAAWTYGMYAVGSAFMPAAIGAAAIGATALGVSMWEAGESPLEYFTKSQTHDYMRKHASLEMGAPITDSQFGHVATMRQRSLNAIRNSSLNGRNAMGNEASLMYQPYNMRGFGR